MSFTIWRHRTHLLLMCSIAMALSHCNSNNKNPQSSGMVNNSGYTQQAFSRPDADEQLAKLQTRKQGQLKPGQEVPAISLKQGQMIWGRHSGDQQDQYYFRKLDEDKSEVETFETSDESFLKATSTQNSKNTYNIGIINKQYGFESCSIEDGSCEEKFDIVILPTFNNQLQSRYMNKTDLDIQTFLKTPFKAFPMQQQFNAFSEDIAPFAFTLNNNKLLSQNEKLSSFDIQQLKQGTIAKKSDPTKESLSEKYTLFFSTETFKNSKGEPILDLPVLIALSNDSEMPSFFALGEVNY